MSLEISHDWDLWLRIAHENNIHYINSVLGTLNLHEGSVITEIHKRRKECRKIIKKWVQYVDGIYYRKVMLYYYLMEIFDILPKKIRKSIRSAWYRRDKYK